MTTFNRRLNRGSPKKSVLNVAATSLNNVEKKPWSTYHEKDITGRCVNVDKVRKSMLCRVLLHPAYTRQDAQSNLIVTKYNTIHGKSHSVLGSGGGRRDAKRGVHRRSHMGKHNNITTREIWILATRFMEQKLILFRCRTGLYRPDPARPSHDALWRFDLWFLKRVNRYELVTFT